MSTDQTTIDRLRAELAEARAVATKLQAENRELQNRLDFIRAYARGQEARHTALDISPGGDDWNMLFDLVTA